MRAACVVGALAALLLAPALAGAQSRRLGSFEIGGGLYYPDIDSQPGLGTPLPFENIFGTKRGFMFRVGGSYAILKNVGTLEVGLKTGLFRFSANSLELNLDGTISADKSADTTAFNVIPTSLMLTYRFDLLAERYPVPLAPYVRATLERYNWWASGQGKSSHFGATNGWSATVGLALLLDFFDRQLARDLDNDTGINHTYIFADVTKTSVDDFGSSRSWNLSDTKLSLAFGLLFVY